MDTIIQEALLALLRLGLWENQQERFDFKLTTSQWEQVYHHAVQQTVEGVVFAGIQRIPHSTIPPRDLLLRWAVRTDKIERCNERMDMTLVSQYRWFAKKQVFPLLLKGQSIGAFYPRPHLRVCGDIDWYLNQKDYTKSRQLLEKAGKRIVPMAGFSLMYEWKGVVVEHHRHLFDVYSPWNRRYLDRVVRTCADRYRSLRCYDVDIPVLPAELQVVQVACHILKHVLAFGIGLRQICDIAVLYHVFEKEIDAVLLGKIYKRLRIYDWMQQLHLLLVNQLGLREASIPFELPKTGDGGWLLQEILTTGNFGFYDQRYGEDTDMANRRQRPQARRRWWRNFRQYLRYAPEETIAFPFVHLYSRLFVK